MGVVLKTGNCGFSRYQCGRQCCEQYGILQLAETQDSSVIVCIQDKLQVQQNAVKRVALPAGTSKLVRVQSTVLRVSFTQQNISQAFSYHTHHVLRRCKIHGSAPKNPSFEPLVALYSKYYCYCYTYCDYYCQSVKSQAGSCAAGQQILDWLPYRPNAASNDGEAFT